MPKEAAKSEDVILRSTADKLVWLRLKGGGHVSIPARGEIRQPRWECESNAALRKLIAQGVVKPVTPAAKDTPAASRSRKATTETKTGPAEPKPPKK